MIGTYLKELRSRGRGEGKAAPRSERDIYTYVARVESAIRAAAGEPVEWKSNTPRKADPWKEQETIRGAWRDIAAALRATGEKGDQGLAEDVERFVSNMPPIMTQQQRIATQFLEQRQAERDKLKGQGRAPAPQRPTDRMPDQPGRAVAPDDNEKGRER